MLNNILSFFQIISKQLTTYLQRRIYLYKIFDKYKSNCRVRLHLRIIAFSVFHNKNDLYKKKIKRLCIGVAHTCISQLEPRFVIGSASRKLFGHG